MPPRQDSDTSHRNGDIPIREIVFSCGVCQKLVSDVYSTKESDHGFNSSDHEESGVVVKFWMADCSHTFCAKHLEGGGVPFHQEGQHPLAPCPVCVASNPQRTTPRELFVIRGLSKGEYADEIPDTYLVCPPPSLAVEDAELDPLRFQYSQILRYSKAVTLRWRCEQRKRRILESSISKERKQWRKQEADMKDRIVVLEKGEAKLKKWEQRREMINHYLGLVGKMGE
ncbi:hypothetical protein DOTSEDRAFT_140871 [Dothistroma septosporum NZE10]|uniref:Uncharacterized protein n=1 Tax=Dothistroma septosporum (strain NZE10 / CBS 128990) TaxID=675120 RepID=N1PDK9_DOTSN|nr:hypothetical protein DOTSEDRAFT_140871 [Dothistroma septosporum NZE10]